MATGWSRLVCALVGIAALGGCSTGDEESESASESPTESTQKAHAVVVAQDVLARGCEDLSGRYAALHMGAQIELVDSEGETVDLAELTNPPEQPDHAAVCAWGATFHEVPEGGDKSYVARIGGWSSEPVNGADLQTQRLVVEATSSE